MNTDDATIVNNEAENRFETCVNGEIAFIGYHRVNETIVFDHTEVPPALEGHGLAGRLTKTALEYARSQHLKVIARCSYVESYIRKHPEYEELVRPE